MQIPVFSWLNAPIRASMTAFFSTLAMGLLLGACAPYYYPPPQPQLQPQVVIIKQCECPAQGLGYVKINSAPPFASVSINGKPEGETPLEYFAIPAGPVRIECVHRQFGPVDTIIQVKPGQKIDLKIRFAQMDEDAP